MIPAFNPRVLEQDKQEVVRAHALCHVEKTKIYARLGQVNKLAAVRGRSDLADAAELWSNLADRVVSTNFDLVHYKAQIKKAYASGNTDNIPELERIRDKVLKLNEESKRDYPAAQKELERVFAEVKAKEKKDDDGDPSIIRFS